MDGTVQLVDIEPGPVVPRRGPVAQRRTPSTGPSPGRLPKPIPGASVHAPHGHQDNQLVERRSCASCSINYYARKDQRSCPLCQARDENRRLVALNDRLTNELSLATQTVGQYQAQLSDLEAMREALSITSQMDLAWTKSVVYRWQQDKTSITLSAVPVNNQGRWGFIAKPKHLAPEEYECTSIGGVALAAAYANATKLMGNVKALEMLARAVGSHLKNERP